MLLYQLLLYCNDHTILPVRLAQLEFRGLDYVQLGQWRSALQVVLLIFRL